MIASRIVMADGGHVRGHCFHYLSGPWRPSRARRNTGMPASQRLAHASGAAGWSPTSSAHRAAGSTCRRRWKISRLPAFDLAQNVFGQSRGLDLSGRPLLSSAAGSGMQRNLPFLALIVPPNSWMRGVRDAGRADRAVDVVEGRAVDRARCRGSSRPGAAALGQRLSRWCRRATASPLRGDERLRDLVEESPSARATAPWPSRPSRRSASSENACRPASASLKRCVRKSNSIVKAIGHRAPHSGGTDMGA